MFKYLGKLILLSAHIDVYTGLTYYLRPCWSSSGSSSWAVPAWRRSWAGRGPAWSRSGWRGSAARRSPGSSRNCMGKIIHNEICSTEEHIEERERESPLDGQWCYVPRHQKQKGNAAQPFGRRPRLRNLVGNEPHHPSKKCHWEATGNENSTDFERNRRMHIALAKGQNSKKYFSRFGPF